MHPEPHFTVNFHLFLIKLLACILMLGTARCNKDRVDASATGSGEQVLDTSFPVVIGEDEDRDGSSSLPKSYFGYSVSLASGKTGSEKSDGDPDGWLFVGAPKSNATRDMYASKTTEPGVIWRCSLGIKPAVQNDICERVNIDPTPSSKRKNGPFVESFNGAWIGASMELNYERLITCGMRWNRGLKYFNGICYWFADTDGTKSSYISKDLSTLVDKSWYDQRLTTFFRAAMDQDKLFRYSNSTNSSAHDWQISQGGMSVHLFLDESLGPLPNLLIGAPGVREWSGAVALYTNRIETKKDMTRPNWNRNAGPIFSEFLVGNRAPIIPPESGKRNYWNEYFGYAVTSGRYINKNKILYASGAPRAHHSGEVVIFLFPPYMEPDNTYKREIVPILEIPAPKNSFASYFGSVLHSADLDGDGLDELIVGAPLYTFSSVNRDKDVDQELVQKGKASKGEVPSASKTKRDKPDFSEELGDHGCVFIYRFNASEIQSGSKNSHPTQFLVGSKAPRARFGSAITSIIMNMKNGTREAYLVVGAPYEEMEEHPFSSGAIYVYTFNEKLGRSSNFIQRIFAASVDPTLNGFGSSLSIPQDVDANETPDVAVGAYKSGSVVVLRTRPRILLKSWIIFISPDGKEVRRGVQQFDLKSCFSVLENLGLVDNKLNIWVKVRFTDRSIHFHEDLVNARKGNLRNEIIYNITVNAHTSESCKTLTVVADHKDGIGGDDSDTLSDILHPFHFFQEVKYNETLNQPLALRKYYASTNDRQSSLVEFSSFRSRKPSPQISKIGADLKISLKDCRDSVCQPEIKITWEFLNDKNETIPTFVLGLMKEVTMRVNISNSGETTPKPGLNLRWDVKQIYESTSGGRWINRTCKNVFDTTAMIYACQLGAYFKKGRTISFNVRLNMDEIFVDSQSDKLFTVKAKVSFEDSHIEEVVSSGSLPLDVPDTMIALTGSRENDSTLRTPHKYTADLIKTNEKHDESSEVVTSLYSSFRQRFTVEIRGASVSKVKVFLKIPLFQHSSEGAIEPLLLVHEPQISSVDANCRTKRFGFHSIQLLDDHDSTPSKSNTVSLHFDGSSIEDAEIDNVDRYLVADPTFQIRRVKRDSNDANETEVRLGNDISIAIDVKNNKLAPKEEKLMAPENALKLVCEESGSNCLEVECTITNLRANTYANIPIEMYPVKDRVDKALESTQKSALFIETAGYAQIFHDAKHHEDSDIAQTVLIKISKKEAELWVYIAAGACGVILLALIIIALYKCGFFKREKRQQLNQMKAEHHRKSMMAVARQSIMQSGGSVMGFAEDFESQEILTEAEHSIPFEEEKLERRQSVS